jgi:alpha-galactosidase
MGIPAARQYITDTMSNMITEHGVDIFREDFNIDPLLYWREYEPANRQGYTEAKYIEGFYQFWDDLLARHPGLVIDNCASGGRRIDLETIRRSVPLWRSDLQCSPWYNPTGSQCQTFGLSTWIPLHSTGAHGTGDLYDFRSAVSSGLSSNWPGVERPDFPIAWMKKVMTEAAFLREYHYGSFYPLTTFSLNNDVWLAYQLDRSDLGKGVILAYRREDCPYPILSVKLHDLDPAAIYEVKGDAGFKTQRFTGKNLMARGLDLYLKNPKSSILVTYSKKG